VSGKIEKTPEKAGFRFPEAHKVASYFLRLLFGERRLPTCCAGGGGGGGATSRGCARGCGAV
jgi:hypothetical protein